MAMPYFDSEKQNTLLDLLSEPARFIHSYNTLVDQLNDWQEVLGRYFSLHCC